MASRRRSEKILIVPSWYPSREEPLNGFFVQEQAKVLATRYEVHVLAPRFVTLFDVVAGRMGPCLAREHADGVTTWRIRRIKVPTVQSRVPFLASPDAVFVYYQKFAR